MRRQQPPAAEPVPGGLIRATVATATVRRRWPESPCVVGMLCIAVAVVVLQVTWHGHTFAEGTGRSRGTQAAAPPSPQLADTRADPPAAAAPARPAPLAPQRIPGVAPQHEDQVHDAPPQLTDAERRLAAKLAEYPCGDDPFEAQMGSRRSLGFSDDRATVAATTSGAPVCGGTGRPVRGRVAPRTTLGWVSGAGSGDIIRATALMAGPHVSMNRRNAKPRTAALCASRDLCWVEHGPAPPPERPDVTFNGGFDETGPSGLPRLVSPPRGSYMAIGVKQQLEHSVSAAAAKQQDDGFRTVMPVSFNLPHEREELVQAVAQASPAQLWIAKPSTGHSSKGVFVFNGTGGIPPQSNDQYVVQEYLDPLLVKGLKWDMRAWALVRTHPLRVYVFDDGVVRFSSEPYTGTVTTDFEQNKCVFVSGQGFQEKHCPKFHMSKDWREPLVTEGHCWTWRAMSHYLSVQGHDGQSRGDESGARRVDVERMWRRLSEVMVRAIAASDDWVAAEPHVDDQWGYFGGDVAFDASGDARLLEMNAYPSTGGGNPVTAHLKASAMTDMWRMLGVGGYERRRYSDRACACIEAFCAARARGKEDAGGGAADGDGGGDGDGDGGGCTEAERATLWQLEDEAAYAGALSVGFGRWRRAFPSADPGDALTGAGLSGREALRFPRAAFARLPLDRLAEAYLATACAAAT